MHGRPRKSGRSRAVATLVAFVAGTLGVHRFYLYGFGDVLGWLHPWPTLIGVYVIFLAIGAFTLPVTTRWLGARNALVGSALLVALGYGLWLPFHDSTSQALVNMAIVGVGSGALVAALPASAAAGAPSDRTAFATGMTNATKTMGGAIASAVFAIALSSTGSIQDPVKGHAPLHGYLVVWSVCAVAALLAALGLLLMPRAAVVRED